MDSRCTGVHPQCTTVSPRCQTPRFKPSHFVADVSYYRHRHRHHCASHRYRRASPRRHQPHHATTRTTHHTDTKQRQRYEPRYHSNYYSDSHYYLLLANFAHVLLESMGWCILMVLKLRLLVSGGNNMPRKPQAYIRCKYCQLTVEREEAAGLFEVVRVGPSGPIYVNFCHRCKRNGENVERSGEAIYPQPSVFYRIVHGLDVSKAEMRKWESENNICRYPVPDRKWHNRKAYYRHRKMYLDKAKRRVEQRTPEEHRYWSNRRRVKEKNAPGSHTQREWERLVAKYDGKCLCCGSTENITRDHVVPLSLGGSDDISNLQPLCHACNSAKQAQTIDYRSDSPAGRQ